MLKKPKIITEVSDEFQSVIMSGNSQENLIRNKSTSNIFLNNNYKNF